MARCSVASWCSCTSVLLFCLTISFSASQIAEELNLNSSLYYAIVPENSVQTSGVYILTVGFTRPPAENEIGHAILFGSDSAGFHLNTTSYIIATSDALQAGQYDFEVIVIVSGSPSRSIRVPVQVDVIGQDDACLEQAFGECSQICQEGDGTHGYTCSCLEGYTLQLDGYSCLANSPFPELIFSHSGGISSFNLLASSTTPLLEENRTELFDYYYEKQIICFTDKSSQQIFSFSLVSGNTSLLAEGTVGGLAVDWVEGNVIFSDSEKGEILQVHLDTGLQTTLLPSLDAPRSLTVQANLRLLFWVEGSDPATAKIMRTSLNASSHTTGPSVVLANVSSPRDLTVDVVRDMLYWIAGGGTIGRATFEGTSFKQIPLSEGLAPVSIAVFEHFLYVLLEDGIARINLIADQKTRLYSVEIVAGPRGSIKLSHPLNQPISIQDVDECLISNGGCSHFCINTVGSYRCACPVNYVLRQDEKTCVNEDECDPTLLSCEQGCALDREQNQTVCVCNSGYQLSSNNTSCIDVDECQSSGGGFCSHLCHNTVGGFQCSCPQGLYIAGDRRTCEGCSINNGRCSQLCIELPDASGFQCECMSGFKLGSDGSTCFRNEVTDLLVSTTVDAMGPKGSVFRTDLSGNLLEHQVYTSSGGAYTGLIYALEYDLQGGSLFYGDRNTSSLWRVPLTKTLQSDDGRTKLLDDFFAWSMAYDWTTGFLYWTDDMLGEVKRVNVTVNPVGAVEVVKTGLSALKGIVVNPFTKSLHWVQNGSIVRFDLEEAQMDTVLTGLENPSGLTIDFLQEELVWIESNTIKSSSLSGSNVQTILSSAFPSPAQIGLHGNDLIWISIGEAIYRKVERSNPSEVLSFSVTTNDGTMHPLYGLAVLNENRQPNQGHITCLKNTLECSYYCDVDSDTGIAHCSCPDGYTLLHDGQSCAYTTPCLKDACEGNFKNLSTLPTFSRPSSNEGPLNSPENAIQMGGVDVTDCQLLSAVYQDNGCQEFDVPDDIITVTGNLVYGRNRLDPGWRQISERLVKLTVQCSAQTFCLLFIVEELVQGNCYSDICKNGGTCEELETGVNCLCAPGFTGGDCSVNIDDCDPDPCLNGGTCEDGINDYVCHCAELYIGQNCQRSRDMCYSDMCQNGGTCAVTNSSVNCSCSPGFTGDFCELDINECSENPCGENGECMNTQGSFTCNCSEGFTGENCAENINDCDPDSCDRGTCIDGVASFTCVCDSGFTGTTCDSDIDECSLGICENGASCSNKVGSYDCFCSAGYKGINCEESCAAGTFGMDCKETCICDKGDCNNVDGSCSCSEGYTGTKCDTPVCDAPCENDGTCIAPNECQCSLTFTGPTCTSRKCEGNYCNEGTCFVVDGGDTIGCRCPPNTIGQRCLKDDLDSGFFTSETGVAVSVGAVVFVLFVLAWIGGSIALYVRCSKRKKRMQMYGSDLQYENPYFASSTENFLEEERNVKPMNNPVYMAGVETKEAEPTGEGKGLQPAIAVAQRPDVTNCNNDGDDVPYIRYETLHKSIDTTSIDSDNST